MMLTIELSHLLVKNKLSNTRERISLKAKICLEFDLIKNALRN
jgi:hypothetical protein